MACGTRAALPRNYLGLSMTGGPLSHGDGRIQEGVADLPDTTSSACFGGGHVGPRAVRCYGNLSNIHVPKIEALFKSARGVQFRGLDRSHFLSPQGMGAYQGQFQSF